MTVELFHLVVHTFETDLQIAILLTEDVLFFSVLVNQRLDALNDFVIAAELFELDIIRLQVTIIILATTAAKTS